MPDDCHYDKVTIYDRSFWDLWIQKLLRNMASIKYQFMVAFYWLILYGMFFETNADGTPFIGATAGLAFLGGSFITLVTSRIVVRTSLFPPSEGGTLDTDK
jgi:hypothetical protein